MHEIYQAKRARERQELERRQLTCSHVSSEEVEVLQSEPPIYIFTCINCGLSWQECASQANPDKLKL